MIGSILAITLLLQSQQTVAVTPAPDAPVIVMSRVEAKAKFKQLCTDLKVTLVFDDGNLLMTVKRSDAERLIADPGAPIDTAFVTIKKTPALIPTSEDVRAAAILALADRDRMLKALAAALNPLPNWPQLVMNGDASVCNRNPKPLPVVEVGATWP